MSTDLYEELFAFGKRLAEERNRLGYTQNSLATLMVKTSRTQIKYESGETMPDGLYLIKLYQLGADVTYILTGERMKGALNPEEMALLNGFNALDERGKAGVFGMIRGMLHPAHEEMKNKKTA